MERVIPSWWEGILLALAVFRIVRLVGWDDITAGLRGRLTIPDAFYGPVAKYVAAWRSINADPWGEKRRWTTDHATRPGEAPNAMLYPSGHPDGFLVLDWPMPTRRRFYAAQLARCPWCCGWWVSGGVWFAWSLAPRATLWLCVWPALSATVGLVAKHLDADEKENEPG